MSKCSVLSTSNFRCSHWTGTRPKYCAAAGAAAMRTATAAVPRILEGCLGNRIANLQRSPGIEFDPEQARPRVVQVTGDPTDHPQAYVTFQLFAAVYFLWTRVVTGWGHDGIVFGHCVLALVLSGRCRFGLRLVRLLHSLELNGRVDGTFSLPPSGRLHASDSAGISRKALVKGCADSTLLRAYNVVPA